MKDMLCMCLILLSSGTPNMCRRSKLCLWGATTTTCITFLKLYLFDRESTAQQHLTLTSELDPSPTSFEVIMYIALNWTIPGEYQVSIPGCASQSQSPSVSIPGYHVSIPGCAHRDRLCSLTPKAEAPLHACTAPVD